MGKGVEKEMIGLLIVFPPLPCIQTDPRLQYKSHTSMPSILNDVIQRDNMVPSYLCVRGRLLCL